MAELKSIGVLTSGGDSPGMNACIRGVVRNAIYKGLKVYGIERGYLGLIDGKISEMSSRSVSNIIQRGGTIIKAARCADFETKEGRQKAYDNLKRFNIDALVTIGGNGTYTGADIFYKEHGVPVIGAPGTIDNDLYGTDHTIGYDTAINTAMQAIDKIRDTADSHDRMFFVEVMGRDAGFIAIDVGLSGGAEAILVPEIHTVVDKLVSTIQHGWGRQKTSQLFVVAEGDDAGGVYNVVKKVKEVIPEMDCRIVVLGHIQRGGSPTARDRVLASRLGAAAVDGLLEGRTNEAVGLVNNVITFVSLTDAVKKHKNVNLSLLELVEILST